MASLAQINVLFRADLDQFSTEMQKARREMEKAGKEMQKIGKEMSTYLTAPLAAIAGFSSKISMDFDDSMRKVMATTNATGSEFKAMTATAEEMGAKTRYTASQAAEAMNYMALAGWKSQQIIEGIPGVLALAAASGEDLGMVSDILTDGLTAMGKGAEQASQFVDVLATAASNSNTTVGMLGQAFQYAAPLAGSLKYSVEDLAFAIGLMSNAGIKAEKAGTALRALMTRMVKPTKESQKAMEDLGISVKNTDGSMKPLGDVMEQLRDKFSKLSDSQKGQYAGMLAGQEAISGLLAIVNAAPEDFDKLSKAIENSAGTAQRMQDQMEGGIGGSWREMQSALEGVAIQIGQVLEPALKKITIAIKDVSNWFMELTDTSKTVIVVIGGIAAAIGPLIFGIGAIVKILPVFAAGWNAVTVAMSRTWAVMLANPLTAISIAVAALGLALYAFTREANQANEVQRTLNDVTKEAQKNIAGEKAQLDTLVKTARDETLSKKQREDAIKKLNALSPEYLKGITLETINTREATKAIDDYVKALSRKAMEQAALAKKTELYQKQIDVQMKNAADTGALAQGAFNKLWSAFGIETNDVLIRNRKELEEYIKKAGFSAKAAEGIRVAYEPMLKQKEKEIALIDKQVGALDDLMKAQKEQFVPTDTNVEENGSGGSLNVGGSGDADKFAKGSIAYYEAQIKGLEKMRDATATTRDEWLSFAGQIETVQQKIEAIESKREKATAISMNFEPIPEGSIASYERLIAQKREDIKVTQIGSLQYNALAGEIKDLEFTLKTKIDHESFSAAQESINNLQASIEGQAKAAQDVLTQRQEEAVMYGEIVGGAFDTLSQNFTASMGEIDSGLARFGQSMMATVLKLIGMALSNALANSIVGATQSGNATGPGAVFATPAFIATAVAGVLGAFAAIPKFADGGIVSGPTFGLMGEYAGAANNPEVIAPLNKLKDLIEPSGGGITQITLRGGFVLDGNKLQLVLDRNSTRSKRIG
ncbi:MAG: phage tail tape measure protein [Flavobacteriaceae bacterium]|jgi:TP901 family phage tail tape measure protein|nr:phage tail tape measure protein [Flavobacteriaceae bacterium]